MYRHSYNTGKRLWRDNISEGQSVSRERQKLLNPQLFRVLAPDKAIALITVNGIAFDDVIAVPQLNNDDLIDIKTDEQVCECR